MFAVKVENTLKLVDVARLVVVVVVVVAVNSLSVTLENMHKYLQTKLSVAYICMPHVPCPYSPMSWLLIFWGWGSKHSELFTTEIQTENIRSLLSGASS